MTTGSNSSYTEERALGALKPREFISKAREAAAHMSLTIGYAGDNGFTAYTGNGAFSWNGVLNVKVADGRACISSHSTAYETIDSGKNKDLVATFLVQLDALSDNQNNTNQPAGIQQPSEDETMSADEAPTKSQSFKNLLSIFVPAPGFFITPILINLNILVFIGMIAAGVSVLTPDGESLVRWGANFKPVTLEGQWWRLLTNCFVHIGILHLLLNMYALVYIGGLLEPYLGKARFLAAYLLAGIAASVTSLWWHDLTISAGASGAIFGMYGVFLAMLTSDLIEKEARRSLLTSISIFVGYNLLYGLKGGIDNAAHIGGLISGFIIGFGFLPGFRNTEEPSPQWKPIALVSLLVLGVSFGVYKNLPNDLVIYEKGIKEFTDTETFALSVFKLPDDTPREEKLFSLRDEGLNYWNQNLALVKSFDQLHLPEHLLKRNVLLKEYCELRIKSYELMYRAIAEDSPGFDAEIDAVNKKIEAVIERLGDEG
ncbi:rhomboid family intramembrane serine protease [Niabella yanshanensis]|uniref:Rhomboid family intramembrane serine protease n=1 Tax=Niabella yanshanensis TaxID=577386 RepID=A0ABZ0W8S4_9BACT|nr:rhomboid family intramembrane serine protease [Niabella yanshanensis]WQD39079.1 rhomboid family intramembrane serine protease [Niabella yanshanensis]